MKFVCEECLTEKEDVHFPEGWNYLEIVDDCPHCGNQTEHDYDFCSAECRNKFILEWWPNYKGEMY